MKAIEKYDIIRKARKQEKLKLKKEQASKEKERQDLMRLATRATSAGVNPSVSYWDNCY